MTQASSSLPPAYSHFQTVFERLSGELRQTILGQLEQLEPLLHLVDEPALSSRGDVAGLGSLTRHGDLSNILQSELLLRTEAPLEFLRRIAEAETLYHEREYQDGGAKRVMRLMVSAGPGTLGHGRIFLLAAIFFLARVASLRREVLHWCYLPNATGPVWFDEISVNTVKRFLKTASFREMTVDDAETAREIWSAINLPVKGDSKPVVRDWVIGSWPQESKSLQNSAVIQSRRAIGYRLNPPEIDKPRGAALFLKRDAKTHRPIQFIFPEDKVCLSALNKPFAPIKPGEIAIQEEIADTKKMENWAPNYISAPGGKAKFVKIPGGVLILFHPTDQGFKGQYFLPISQTSKVAGLRLKERQLHVLLQTVSGPQEQLEHSVVELSFDGVKPVVGDTETKPFSSAQLFRDQNRYALPPLAGDINLAFHATNGKPFSLQRQPNGSFSFAADADASHVIYSNGLHRVVLAEAEGIPILRTLRANGSTVHEFTLDSLDFDEIKLRGMLYVSTHGQLSFSMMSNIWTLPGHCKHRFDGGFTKIDPTLQCEFANYEIPLSLRRGGSDIHATIWSDAGRGGDGSVRNLQIRNDRVLSRPKLLDIGPDIGNIAAMIQAEDGIWIVTTDHRGVPATLHHCFASGGGMKRVTHYELDELRNKAQTILLGAGGHG